MLEPVRHGSARRDYHKGDDMESVEFIKSHVEGLPRGECYILCILSRKKNNENMVDSQQIMKCRLIFNHSDVEELYIELIRERMVLKDYDFYMYITACPRSIRKSLVFFIGECVDILANYMTDDGQIKRIAKLSHIWYSILQRPEARGSIKRFILDIDTNDTNTLKDSINRVKELGGTIICTRATRNGYHVLCTPFDVGKFEFTDLVQYKRDGLLFVRDMKEV